MLLNYQGQMATAKLIYWIVDLLGFSVYSLSVLAALVDFDLWKSIPMSICGLVWMYYKVMEKREDIRKKRIENDKTEKESKN